MVDYPRMGTMQIADLENAKSTTSMHHLRDLWKSPRGTVLRLQALAVLVIMTTFFLAAFGSCRRWSNRWIVQKGFFAAHVLSVSLGTYSIGLMQSSSVKSEMYPLWTVSLFTLFGCIDSVTAYNGLDYKGSLSKVVYGICLNCAYSLLMSISTISSVVANTAIVVLATITFIKGFHRSLALVQQSRMRNMVQNLKDDDYGDSFLLSSDPIMKAERGRVIVDFEDKVTSRDIDYELNHENKGDDLWSCYDVCIAFGLSHKLQRHFHGLDYRMPGPGNSVGNINYKWAFKLIEIELAFLYEVFFTGNPFLHYYQAKAASLWALASFFGICFVGVAASVPGTMTSRRSTAGPLGGCTSVVDTTTADLVLTFIILVSLALLQLMHLIRSWTSNWARVAVACAYIRYRKGWTWWLQLKASVATSTNWFDKYLWQDKIGQYSMLPEGRLTWKIKGERRGRRGSSLKLVKMLGLDYIWEVLWDLLANDTNKRAAVKLVDDVRASTIEFLSQVETSRIDGNWLSFSNASHHPTIESFLPWVVHELHQSESQSYRYTCCVMTWQTATWYCKLVEQEQDALLSKLEGHIGCRETAASAGYLKRAAAAVAGCFIKEDAASGEGGEENQNRCVANALSNYCAYLVVSAPELLPPSAPETKSAYDTFEKEALEALYNCKDELLGAMSDSEILTDLLSSRYTNFSYRPSGFWSGVYLAKLLLTRRSDDLWETLARVWVRLLVYAAPYGNVEAHMRHLAQGGEFITHLWALLFHLHIRQWELPHNLHNITNMEEAARIITNGDDKAIVIAFLSSLSGPHSDELATASRIQNGVRFYQTSNPEVAKLFHIEWPIMPPALVLVNNDNFTLYYGGFRAYAIADFLSVNMKPKPYADTVDVQSSAKRCAAEISGETHVQMT